MRTCTDKLYKYIHEHSVSSNLIHELTKSRMMTKKKIHNLPIICDSKITSELSVMYSTS